MRSLALAAALATFGCSDFRPLTDGGVDASGPFAVVQDNPDGGALRAVWGSGPKDVHVVGDNGTILDFDGTQWSNTVSGPAFDFTSVWGTSASDVYAVGTVKNTDKGIVFHKTSDMWIEEMTVDSGLRAVWGTGTLLFAVGLDGYIYQRQDGRWSAVEQVGPNPEILQTDHAPILYGISGNSETSVMVAADVDTTVFFDGTIWHTYADPIDRTRTYRAMWALPDSSIKVYQGANYFGLWLFQGKENPVVQLNEEKDQAIRFSQFLWGIWGPNEDQIICVGDAGRIMSFDKAAQPIRTLPSPTTRSLYGIWGSSTSDVWIVGDGQLILHGAVNF